MYEHLKLLPREPLPHPERRLAELLLGQQGWRIVQGGQVDCLEVELTFESPKETIMFLMFLDDLQTQAQHHASFSLQNFQTLKLQVFTHEPQPGISELDLAFAVLVSAFRTDQRRSPSARKFLNEN